MPNRLDPTLSEVAQETFESLAFMLLMADEDDEVLQAQEKPKISGSISFEGHFRGSVFLSASTEMLPALAANMLGLEDCDTPSLEQQLDAFKELLNVVCGNLLPKIAGSEPVFNVHAPEILSDEGVPQTVDGRAPDGTAKMTFDEGEAELTLFVDTQAAINIGTQP